MGFYPTHLINEIRERTSIVNYINQHVKLKKRGKNFIGLCPFHNEKTPSFTVNEERKSFYCFGCHAKGNVFSFAMDYLNLDFKAAVQEVAQFSGIELYTEQGKQDKSKDIREALANVNEEAAHYFHKLLLDYDTGKIAQEYLSKRGVQPETIKAFQLGYSLHSWDALQKHLTKLRFKQETMIQADLIKKGRVGSSHYDSFRHRLMFPILDEQSRVAGFGGRVLDDSQPKYLNSTNHPLFNKGEMLYNLNLAKAAIREQKLAYIVEGYFDVIGLWQHGIRTAVAPLGTALRMAHLRKLAGYCDQVVLVFDGDTAGLKAAEASIPSLLQTTLKGYVIRLPAGMDPFDYIMQFGIDGWIELVETQAEEALSFKANAAAARFDVDNHVERRQFLEESRTFLQQINDELINHSYAEKLANILGMTVDAVKRYTEQKFTPKESENTPSPIVQPTLVTNYLLQYEKHLLFCLIINEDLIEQHQQEITPDLFHDPSTRTLYTLIIKQKQEQDSLSLESISEALDNESLSNEMYQVVMDHSEPYKTEPHTIIQDCLVRIQIKDYEIRQNQLREMMRKEETLDDTEFYRLCQEEYNFLAIERSRLQNSLTTYRFEVSQRKTS